MLQELKGCEQFSSEKADYPETAVATNRHWLIRLLVTRMHRLHQPPPLHPTSPAKTKTYFERFADLEYGIALVF